MNDNKKKLDEMQAQNRNRIGNQMFMLMIFALYANNVLHGAGITWISYPANIMVIVTACLGVYLVRLVVSDAYLPASRKSIVARLAIAAVISIVIAVIAVIGFMQSSPVGVAETTNDSSSIVLMIISAMGLAGVFILMLTKRANNNDNGES